MNVGRKKVAVLVGSLRTNSLSGRVAKTLLAASSEDLTLKIIEIGGLPLYNQDLEEDLPLAWITFRALINSSDAFLFVTPEHNRSIPAALKNAIEVGSRPYGRSVWDGKPGAVVGVSPGAMGGSAAIQHLRQILVNLNVPCLTQPEVYLGNADKLFDVNGELARDDTREFLDVFLGEFRRWICALS